MSIRRLASLAPLGLLLLTASPARAQFAGCPETGSWIATVSGTQYPGEFVEDGAGNITGVAYQQGNPGGAGLATGTRVGASITQTFAGQPFTHVGTMIDCDTIAFTIVELNLPYTAVRVRSTYCGDGTVQAAFETCDDGNFSNGDGCSVACLPTGCGDHIVDAGEGCDDGNTTGGDGCSATCQVEACGNGVLDVGEGCEDGNLVNGDGCSATCQPNVCGNGTIESGEQCDDGGTGGGDGCSALCQFEGCDVTGEWLATVVGGTYRGSFRETGGAVDGVSYPVGTPAVVTTITGTRTGNALSITTVQGGGTLHQTGTMLDCDTLQLTITELNLTFLSVRQRSTYCGDGTVQASEVCDDGNFSNADACSIACTPTGCGDGIVGAGEQCDDGNLVDGDGCTAACTTQVCGNGTQEAGESCDDGNLVNGDGCSATCHPNVCGNGTVESGEQCDDGDTDGGDGCSALCQFEGCPLTGTWAGGPGDYVSTVVESAGGASTGVFWPAGSPATRTQTTGTRTGAQITTTIDGGLVLTGTMLDCDTIQYTSPLSFTTTRVRSTYCGDGILQGAYETCEDANLENGDGCSIACTLGSGCGNGVVDAGEQCDDGNASNNDACRTGCLANVCGDGAVYTGVEGCDDGNTTGGDGCAADCTLEPVTVSEPVGGVNVTVTTDAGAGATPARPVVTTVGVPPATESGTVTIAQAAAPPSGEPGFLVMGTAVEITLSAITPAPTPAAPVSLVFTLDASQVVPGQDEHTIAVHKDGVEVPDCTGLAGYATPDPCVGVRERLADGDLRFTIYTTTASVWTTIGNVCGNAPLLGCIGALPAKASLKLKHTTSKNQLVWKWKSAAEVPAGLFADPSASSDQTVCVYDPAGRVTYLTAPAGGTCGTKPCWKAAGTGYVYADRTTGSGGIGKLSLKPGPAAQAKVGLKATGPNLRFPTLPLAAPVRVQLRSAAGGCFESVFSAPIANDGIQFKAKSD